MFLVFFMNILNFSGGGSGFIGRSLCKALEKQGYTTKIISRSNKRGQLTWTDIERNGIPEETKAVYNLAGELVLNPLKRWNENLKKEIFDSRIETTRLLRDAITTSCIKPEVWISISGVGYYPPSTDQRYDEDSEVECSDIWSNLTKSWEESANLPEDLTETRHVIIRSGVVIGYKGGALQSMLPPFYLGLGGQIGSGQQWFPWIHLDDLIGIFMHATNHPIEGVLNGVSTQQITNKQFTNALGNTLRRPTVIPLPSFAVQLVFGAERATMLLEGQHVTPKRVIQSIYLKTFS